MKAICGRSGYSIRKHWQVILNRIRAAARSITLLSDVAYYWLRRIATERQSDECRNYVAVVGMHSTHFNQILGLPVARSSYIMDFSLPRLFVPGSDSSSCGTYFCSVELSLQGANVLGSKKSSSHVRHCRVTGEGRCRANERDT